MQKNAVTLAVAMIVKNEGEHLRGCLQTIADWVDEIVILDSGSEDETQKIALEYTDKLYVQDKWPGFGPQRRIAQTYVNSDYVLWLDADERVTPKLKKSIEQVLQSPETKISTVYAIPRSSHAFGKKIRHCGWYPDYVVRLYPTSLTQYDDAPVHEKVLIPKGISVEKLSGDAIHYPYRNLNHYLAKSARYSTAWADKKENEGKTGGILQGIGHGLARFVKMYFLQAGFLDGKQGLLLSTLSAHSTFVKYAELWIRTLPVPPSKTDTPKRINESNDVRA